MITDIDNQKKIIIDELLNTGIKIKISNKLLIKRAKQQLEYIKNQKNIDSEKNKQIKEIEQQKNLEKEKIELEQNILENNWLQWIIYVIKNAKNIRWNYIFDILFTECSLINVNSNMYKHSFYKKIISQLYVYGYLHNFKKELFEYKSTFEYKYRGFKRTIFTAPEIIYEIRYKRNFLYDLDISIKHELHNRENIYSQLQYGYISYILFREKKFDKIPLIVEDLISKFIIGYKYKIKRLK